MSYVYFAVAPDGCLKIGASSSPNSRCAGLGIELIGYMRGGVTAEKAFHSRLSGSLAYGKEWFHPTLDALNYIASLPLEIPTLAAHGRPWDALMEFSGQRASRNWPHCIDDYAGVISAAYSTGTTGWKSVLRGAKGTAKRKLQWRLQMREKLARLSFKDEGI